MAVIMQGSWEGGTPAQVFAAIRKIGDLMVAAGADSYQLARITAGPQVGRYQSSTRFRNWETYGQVMQRYLTDTSFQQAMAELNATTRVVDRALMVTIES